MLDFENTIPLQSAEVMREITRKASVLNSKQFKDLAGAIKKAAEKGEYGARVALKGMVFTKEQLEFLESVLTDAGYQHHIANGEEDGEYNMWVHWHEEDGIPF